MKILSVGEVAYLAGLIDGEGTISIYRSANVRYKNGQTYRPIIEISNTHLGVLQWVADLIGDGWLHQTNPGAALRDNHRPLYRYRFRAQDLRWVIPQLRPFLKIKGEQADLLLQYFDVVKTTRPLDRSGLEPLTTALNVLNRRGPTA